MVTNGDMQSLCTLEVLDERAGNTESCRHLKDLQYSMISICTLEV